MDMKTTAEHKPIISHDEIRKAAYQIWQTEGSQPGRHQAYRLKAEQQLLAARQPENGQTKNPGAIRNEGLVGGCGGQVG